MHSFKATYNNYQIDIRQLSDIYQTPCTLSKPPVWQCSSARGADCRHRIHCRRLPAQADPSLWIDSRPEDRWTPLIIVISAIRGSTRAEWIFLLSVCLNICTHRRLVASQPLYDDCVLERASNHCVAEAGETLMMRFVMRRGRE